MLRKGEELMLMPQGKAEVRKGFLPAGHNVAQLVMCLYCTGYCFSPLTGSRAPPDTG